jgi:hypothetical protein
MKTSGSRDISDVLTQLGPKLLTSQSLLDGGVQNPLPRNQWQLDVTNWWHTVLAVVQIEYVQTAIGTTDPEIRLTDWIPLNDREQKLCNSQVSFTRYISEYVTFETIHSVVLTFSLESPKCRICIVQPFRTPLYVYH